jgi:hypothetical protein
MGGPLNIARTCDVGSTYRILLRIDIINLCVFLLFGTLIAAIEWNKHIFTPIIVVSWPATIWILAWFTFAAGVWEMGDKRGRGRWGPVALVGTMAMIGMVAHILIVYVMFSGFSSNP